MIKNHIKTNLVILLIIVAITTLVLCALGVFVNQSHATNAETDINTEISSYLALTVTPNELSMTASPNGSGDVLVKGEITANTSTNNLTGYSLVMSSSSTNTSLVHVLDSSTTMPSTANITPAALTSSTWGYNIGNAPTTSTFKAIPSLTTPDLIDEYDEPVLNRQTTLAYGVNVGPTQAAGTYANTITFTAVTNELPEIPITCEDSDMAPECIAFTIDVGTTGTYSIPTSGRVANLDHTYDWNVYVDGFLTMDCPSGNCTGTSSTASAGISLTNLTDGMHQILIVPHNSPGPGWGNAFGHYSNTSGANANANKQKLISLDAPLTTMAFAPKTTESSTNALYMFGYLFYNCTNLTTTAQFLDTYKLPSTITNLSGFLGFAHYGNTNLTTPINLSPLSGWFNSNTSITRLSSFLGSAHSGNAKLTTPINLSPLSGWFNSNTSIIDLSSFLVSTHSGDRGSQNLTDPIDLSPLSGWFNSNTSIIDLSSFLVSTHDGNVNLTTPIDLSPLSGWFNSNTSITSLYEFLRQTHIGSPNLSAPIDLSPLSNWFNNNTSVTDMRLFLGQAHYGNSKLTSPINLMPLSNWFATNRTVSLATSNFMVQTHMYNKQLQLTGQVVLPNWLKVLGGNNIVNDDFGAFYQTFLVEDKEGWDTAEIKFEDGSVLSGLGTPMFNRETYAGRWDFTTVNENWR